MFRKTDDNVTGFEVNNSKYLLNMPVPGAALSKA